MAHLKTAFGFLRVARPTIKVFWVLLLASISYAQEKTPLSSEAQITFYSFPITVTGGLPGHKPGAFKGRIFDGDHQLAFMEPAHFITFHVASGVHVFSAASWMNKHADNGAHITLNLEANRHYFVQTGTLSFGPPFVIREVNCADAQRDNPHTKPLELVHLSPDGIPVAVRDTSFPQCP